MPDSKITDLPLIGAGVLDRNNDVFVVVDVSETTDKKIHSQRLFTDTPATTSNAGSMSASDKTKLDGIEAGATANSSDAFLLNRANHTGTQTSSTISDFTEAAQDAVGSALTDTATIDFTYNDAANQISAIVIDNSITDAKLRTSAARSVIGRSAATSGNVADITASADGQFLGRTSGTLSFSVPPTFTASAPGYAPASGGGTTNFLRADGTWAAPSGGGGSGDNIQVNDAAATDANFRDSVPAAPSNGLNVAWQKNTDAPDSISANLPFDIELHRMLKKCTFMYTDFIGNYAAGYAPFVNTVIASGSFSIAGSGTVTTTHHPGVVRISSSTSANSGGRISTDALAFLLGGGETFSCVWRHETFTNTTVRLGFLDVFDGNDAVDGAYLEINTSGVCSAKTSNNSTRTTNSTTVTLSTATWYNCEISVSSGASQVNFLVRNDSGTVLLNVNNTTNIPTGSGRETGAGFVATNSGTTATLLTSIDFMAISYITARTR